jgi:hypothetical protein
MAVHDPARGASALAELLGIAEDELLRAIGGPWSRANGRPSDTRMPERRAGPYPHGEVFVGRAGPSVLLHVLATSHTILIGQAVGDWDGPVDLLWRFDQPRATLRIQDSRRFLEDLKAAVDAAAQAKAGNLSVCRYCGRLLAREHMMRDDQCHGCASSIDQVVY